MAGAPGTFQAVCSLVGVAAIQAWLLAFLFVMQVPDLNFGCKGIHFREGHLNNHTASQATR